MEEESKINGNGSTDEFELCLEAADEASAQTGIDAQYPDFGCGGETDEEKDGVRDNSYREA